MATARVSPRSLTGNPIVYSIERASMNYTSRGGTVTGAVRNVSLRVACGEMLAITGRSGSGKSSLLQLLAGLDKPTSGEIHFHPGGNEEKTFALHSMSEDGRARFRGAHVGFVFQAFHLLPALTAWENVAIPLLFAGVPLARRHEEAHTLLDLLGMRVFAERYPYELSGGQQQRIAVARALANKPSVLLADEPTGNLDSASADSVIEMILAAHRERGITTVLVTHDPEVAKKLGARTVAMHDGAIMEDSEWKTRR